MLKYTMGDEVLGGWRITRLIGEGAFGRVFEVEKSGFGLATKSALKVVSIPPSESMAKSMLAEGMDQASVADYFRGVVDDFAREVALLSRLSHPGIVSYQDHAIVPHEDGAGWDVLLRMELLEPLTSRMSTGTLPEAEVVRLGAEVADALAYCHSRKIVHRDVKPANLFLDQDERYKIGDFGVSRTMEHTTGALSHKGTEAYMAPELFRGEPYGADVDVYALGLVLYQLLNGNRLPFLPPTPAPVGFHDREMAKARRLSGEALPVLDGCDPDLFEAVRAACSADPAMRPSAAQLRDVLLSMRGDGSPFVFDYASNSTAGEQSSAPDAAQGSAAGERLSEVGDASGEQRSTVGVWTRFGANSETGSRAQTKPSGPSEGQVAGASQPQSGTVGASDTFGGGPNDGVSAGASSGASSDDDRDQRIVDWLADKFQADNGIDLRADKMALQRLKEASEKARIELISTTKTRIILPFIAADASGPKHLEYTLTRVEFERLIASPASNDKPDGDVTVAISVMRAQVEAGESVIVKNAAGKQLKINLPKSIRNGQMLYVRGQGNPTPSGIPGDLYIRVEVMEDAPPTPSSQHPKQTAEGVLADEKNKRIPVTKRSVHTDATRGILYTIDMKAGSYVELKDGAGNLILAPQKDNRDLSSLGRIGFAPKEFIDAYIKKNGEMPFHVFGSYILFHSASGDPILSGKKSKKFRIPYFDHALLVVRNGNRGLVFSERGVYLRPDLVDQYRWHDLSTASVFIEYEELPLEYFHVEKGPDVGQQKFCVSDFKFEDREDIVDWLMRFMQALMREIVNAQESANDNRSKRPAESSWAHEASGMLSSSGEENGDFNVVLESYGEDKILTIKAVRVITNSSLKEALEKVDAAPTTILEGVSKERAEKAKAILEEAGAIVALRKQGDS